MIFLDSTASDKIIAALSRGETINAVVTGIILAAAWLLKEAYSQYKKRREHEQELKEQQMKKEQLPQLLNYESDIEIEIKMVLAAISKKLGAERGIIYKYSNSEYYMGSECKRDVQIACEYAEPNTTFLRPSFPKQSVTQYIELVMAIERSETGYKYFHVNSKNVNEKRSQSFFNSKTSLNFKIGNSIWTDGVLTFMFLKQITEIDETVIEDEVRPVINKLKYLNSKLKRN